MPYEIRTLDKIDLREDKVLNVSAHPVIRCCLGDTAAGQLLRQKQIDHVYIKTASPIERREEATFSALYQLDIGEHAAKSYLLAENGIETGIASIGLRQFVEYRKLFTNEYQGIQRSIFERRNGRVVFKSQAIKGLASVLLSSWLYAEDDLHGGNFGLALSADGNLIWVRLDFGMSFASITHQGRVFRERREHFNRLEREDLICFPDLKKAAPFYWPTLRGLYSYHLNINSHNAYRRRDKLLFESLYMDEVFNKEKYAFLVKQFLVDLTQKKQLIKHNILEPRATRLAISIEARINMLRWAALSDPKFCEYVRVLASDEGLDQKNTLFQEVSDATLAVLGEGAAVDASVLQHRFAQLEQYVDWIQAEETLTLSKNQWSQLRMGDDESTTAATNPLTLSQIEEFFAEPSEWLMEENPLKIDLYIAAKLNLARKHAESGLASSHLNQAINEINHLFAQRAVLEPVNQLIQDAPFGQDVLSKTFFTHLRNWWLLPLLQALPEAADQDDMYQQNMLTRLRNIHQLMLDLRNHVTGGSAQPHKELFQTIEKLYGDAVQKEASQEEISSALADIECRLVHMKYQQDFVNMQVQLDALASDPEVAKVFQVAARCINAIVQTHLPVYLVAQYSIGTTVEELEKKDFIRNLTSLRALFNKVLYPLAKGLASKAPLPESVTDVLSLGGRRLQQVLEKRDLTTLLQEQTPCKEAFGKLNHGVREVNFVLSHLALDTQRVCSLHSQTKAWGISTGFEAIFPNWHEQLLAQLIEASQQLSWALAKPNYHDKDMQHDIAQAAFLAHRALSTPSVENAQACLEHAKTLGLSHKTRLATKVALALAVTGILICGITTMSMLSPLSLPFMLLFAPLAVKITCVVSAALALGAGSYALKRALHDKDKVNRYLSYVGETAHAVASQHMNFFTPDVGNQNIAQEQKLVQRHANFARSSVPRACEVKAH